MEGYMYRCIHVDQLSSAECCTAQVLLPTGTVDVEDLAVRVRRTREAGHGCLCVLTAVSNVTGAICEVAAVTSRLKEANPGAVVCWDFAAAASHQAIDLNPPDASAVDVAFFSPHKLVGGPGSAGLLVAKKHLLLNQVPAVVGGGVVFYVTGDDHAYISNVEEREEAGTPNILACIRTGIVYYLHSQFDTMAIHDREARMMAFWLERWREVTGIELPELTLPFEVGSGLR